MPDRRSEDVIRRSTVLIADRSQFARRLTRNMLTNLGVRSIAEADDGPSTLEAIRSGRPDALLIDWELPGISGLDVIRTIRSPGEFPWADLPIIMLTMWTERRYVLKALRCGANEFLAKPTSTLALRDRLISVLSNRRAMVKLGDYYVPQPRAWPTRAERSG